MDKCKKGIWLLTEKKIIMDYVEGVWTIMSHLLPAFMRWIPTVNQVEVPAT